jgi:hypothetical protein
MTVLLMKMAHPIKNILIIFVLSAKINNHILTLPIIFINHLLSAKTHNYVYVCIVL